MGTKLYVGNLPYDVAQDDLRALFAQVGAVASCDIVMDKYTNQARGFAFVEMGSQEDTKRAIAELNGKDFQGRAMVVNEARPREERPSFGGGGGGGGAGRVDRREKRDFRGGGGGRR